MKRLIALLIAILLIALAINGCTGTSTTNPEDTRPRIITLTPATPTTTKPPTSPIVITPQPGANKYGGVVRWIESAGPATPLGWPAESAGISVFSMQLSLQFLLKEQLGGALTPNLAESYDVVTDPSNPSITFHLRRGVRFHDGTDFNASAVKFCFERTKATGIIRSTTMFWDSFDVIDNYTLRVNLTNWFNRLVRVFADSVAFVVSPTAYETLGLEGIRWNMVGTGPFTQKQFKRDVSLDVGRNEEYYEEGKPYLDGVELLYVSDELTRLAFFKSGGAEVLNLAGNPRYAGDLTEEGYKIITQPGGAMVLVPDSLNASSPWSNLKVREAADHAIDKEAIAKTFGYNYWIPAYQINSPSSMAYDSSLPGRNYDVNKSKQLLTEAGFPNGFKTEIIVQSGGNMDIPVAIQSYLDRVGIKATISVKEPAAYTQITSGTWNNALVLNPLIEWANPNTGFNFFFGSNSAWFRSLGKPEGWAEAVLESNVSSELDPVLTKRLESMAYNGAMVIPLYYGISLWATTPNLNDSGIGTRGAETWWEPQNAWLSK